MASSGGELQQTGRGRAKVPRLSRAMRLTRRAASGASVAASGAEGCSIILSPVAGRARSPGARGGFVVLMAQARLLLFGVALLTLVLPGPPLAPLSGLPLGLPALWLVVLVLGWALALPGTPPRPKLLIGGFV